jgi:LmbE family N-acetylglucosaminyl deacetylase
VEARHPDHSETGHLVRRAVFFAGLAKYAPELGAPHRPTRLIHYPQRQEARPDFVVDITAVAARKRAAILAHGSQVGPGEATLLNHPLGTAAWEVRDRYWGASIGVELGEPYVLGGPVPLADPVAHFCAHPQTPVLVPR